MFVIQFNLIFMELPYLSLFVKCHENFVLYFWNSINNGLRWMGMLTDGIIQVL